MAIISFVSLLIASFECIWSWLLCDSFIASVFAFLAGLLSPLLGVTLECPAVA